MHTNVVRSAHRPSVLPMQFWIVAMLLLVMGLLGSRSSSVWAQGPGSNTLAQNFEPIIGQDQPIAVVVCRYNGTEAPPFSVQEWAEVLSNELNRYFAEATNRLTMFQFDPVEGDCEFPYTYEDTAPGGSASLFPEGVGSLNDDPQVRVREVSDAIAFAEQQEPGIFTRLSRILLIINRQKRAVGFPQVPLIGGFGISYSLIPKSATATEITEADIALVAHEIGHQMALPDLYAYYGGPSPVASWAQMGSQRLQHFMGYSRRLTGWLNPQQEQTLARPLFGQVQEIVRLHPPTMAGAGDIELLRLPFDPTGLAGILGGYLVEARPKVSLDATHGSNDNLGLPMGYAGGVLVTRVNEFVSPAIAQPLIGAPVVEIQHDGNIADAALQPGEQFVDPDTGLTVEVLSANSDASFDVQITWGEDNWPDLQVVDTWLDHPDNGFGTFFTPPGGAFNDPIFFGDLPAGRTTVRIIPPALETVPVTHRLFVRVRNSGNANAPTVTGTLHILRPSLPSSFDPADPATYLPLQVTSRAVNFGPVAAGGTAVQFINLNLDGPVGVVVEVDQLDGEPNFPNNVRFEIFPPGVSISPGSPYPATSATFTVVNGNPLTHIAIPLIHDLPPQWQAEVTPEAAALAKGEKAEFKITIQPPDPSLAKPGTFETIDVVTWIDTEHSLLPLATFPAYVSLTFRTKLEVALDDLGSDVAAVRARFTYLDLDGKEAPVEGQQIALAVTGDDGSADVLYGKTDGSGQTEFKVKALAGVRQAVVAQFLGSQLYRSAVSESLFLEQNEPVRPVLAELSPKQVEATGKSFILKVFGVHFTKQSVVLVNDQERKTRPNSPASLETVLEEQDTAKPGKLQIAVLNKDSGLRSKEDAILEVISPGRK